jgi:hypothetical protein
VTAKEPNLMFLASMVLSMNKLIVFMLLLVFIVLCLAASIPHLVRNGLAAATLLLAVLVLALIGASVAVWLGR